MSVLCGLIQIYKRCGLSQISSNKTIKCPNIIYNTKIIILILKIILTINIIIYIKNFEHMNKLLIKKLYFN